MKRFVLLGLVVFLVMLSVVSYALPITTDRIRIWQEGNEAFLALQVDDLPAKFEINKKSTPDMTIDYEYRVFFYDGEYPYECGGMNYKLTGAKAKTVPISDFEHSLYQIDMGANRANRLTYLSCHVEDDWIIWTIELPAVDFDGKEVEINFDNITYIGFDFTNSDLDQKERKNYEINADGTLTELEDQYFSSIRFSK